MASTGRPRLLTPELMEKAESYINKWRELGDKVPGIESFAVFIGVARSTVYKWADEDERFSDILEEINAKQARELINNGLDSTFNHSITKMMLTKHGYTDKTENLNTLQGANGGPIQVESSLDVSGLSSETLEELANLRRKQSE